MYLTTQQAAAYLGILPTALRMHIRRGTLTPSFGLGRRFLFTQEDLDRQVTARTIGVRSVSSSAGAWNMAQLADLDPWNGLPSAPSNLLAIGWLGGHSAAELSRRDAHGGQVFSKLATMMANPWQPFLMPGRHLCGFCRFSGGPSSIVVEGRSIELGASMVFVPHGPRAYVAPSMILHYMDAHAYDPPATFGEAVMECPPMKSMAYLRMVRELGLHKLSGGSQSSA